MNTVSMLHLRRHALKVVRSVQRGQSAVLTYRGEPVARIVPIDTDPRGDDRFYSLGTEADADATPLTNQEIDEAVYGA